jgi:hypothetical protein
MFLHHRCQPMPSVRPAELATTRAGELARLGAATLGGLAVSVSTNRGTGAAYRDGEELTALVSVNKDAYVRLYHVDGTGHIQLIWPNRFSGGNGLMKAGTAIKLPGPGDPFAFRASATVWYGVPEGHCLDPALQ